MDKIVNEYKLNVVSKASYQFQPFGATIVYVLSESHLSIHTFVEERKIAMDLYTCSFFKNAEQIPIFITSVIGFPVEPLHLPALMSETHLSTLSSSFFTKDSFSVLSLFAFFCVSA